MSVWLQLLHHTDFTKKRCDVIWYDMIYGKSVFFSAESWKWWDFNCQRWLYSVATCDRDDTNKCRFRTSMLAAQFCSVFTAVSLLTLKVNDAKHTHTLTEAVLMKLGVLSAGQGSTPFQQFVESRSWPGHRWGYTSQTYTRRSSVLLQRHNMKVDVSVLFLFGLQRSGGLG